MKLATVFTGVNYTKNWKVLVLIAGLILSTTLTSCSPTPTATPDAMKGDAMKGDAMKGDAMKDKGDAMKGDPKATPTTKP
ncbi:pentapeptide MXKDX repeat protein [Chamaesiphon sp. OTE_75_metabat_556]|uniref:pentapeptide MXKDX repeat protein n=1 Tax=Chamaesiphon sp. OTE_75_metabat_556 TaxID=2964692 RepID=UPI00286B89A6|nr:pentapeptide MXKDX repeat protein [Chamaesiphon sp. OTE_75_metabat_556]